MRAMVAHVPHDYRLGEASVPAIGPSEVLLQVEASGVCASDVKCFKGARVLWGGNGQPCWVRPPAILRYELIGKLGRFVEFSVCNGSTMVDWTTIRDRKELDIYGALLGPNTYQLAIDFLDTGQTRMEGVVMRELPLEWLEEAIHLVASGGESIKVLLEPCPTAYS